MISGHGIVRHAQPFQLGMHEGHLFLNGFERAAVNEVAQHHHEVERRKEFARADPIEQPLDALVGAKIALVRLQRTNEVEIVNLQKSKNRIASRRLG